MRTKSPPYKLVRRQPEGGFRGSIVIMKITQNRATPTTDGPFELSPEGERLAKRALLEYNGYEETIVLKMNRITITSKAFPDKDTVFSVVGVTPESKRISVHDIASLSEALAYAGIDPVSVPNVLNQTAAGTSTNSGI